MFESALNSVFFQHACESRWFWGWRWWIFLNVVLGHGEISLPLLSISILQQILFSRTKRWNSRLESWKVFYVLCALLKKGFKQGTQHSTHEDAFAGSGVKAPFSLFRSWNSMLYFEPACAYYVCMSHSCWWICIFHKFFTIRVLVMDTVNCTIGDALILPWKTTAQQDHFFTSLV